MRLLLIRHGETVDNVSGIYAGITDSALTNHGVLQAKRLGAYLSAMGMKVSHIFSSDLQRAIKTAEAIRDAQTISPPEPTKLQLLREQDFGFYEGKKTFERTRSNSSKNGGNARADVHRKDPGFQDAESKESMRMRMNSFVDTYLVQLFHQTQDNHTVVVVGHGIILNYLWRVVLKRFHPRNVSVETGVQAAGSGQSLEHLGSWSNTGYLDLEVISCKVKKPAPETASQILEPVSGLSLSTEDIPQKPAESSLASPDIHSLSTTLDISLVVKAVNSLDHLKGLKKTRGGLGSLKHDSTQKTMDSFFKKRRIE